MTNPPAVIARFNDAFRQHDPAMITDLLTRDCRLHTSAPAPAGTLIEGRQDCAAYWGRLAGDPRLTFLPVEVMPSGRRVVVRWRCLDAAEREVMQGINVFTVDTGLIARADGFQKTVVAP